MDTMETPTLNQLAGEAYAAFERIQRGDETIIVLKQAHRDDSDWIYELVHSAHGGLFLRDDWRYENIRAILGAIHDMPEDADLDDASHEIVDGLVDNYTGNRLRWLASNLNRLSYVDEAVDEYGGESLDTAERIGLGQYAELEEIYASVIESLRERLEELEEISETVS